MAKELDLTNPGTVRAVARRAGVRVNDRFSQNFLIDRSALDAIVDALDPGPQDTVLEIGPGLGTLTGALAARAGRVIAVEIDPACAEATRITQRHRDNVEIIEADAMSVDLGAIGLPERWLAAGNLPYHLTGALLSRLFELARPPERGVFLIQREVAQRLAAEAGDWSLATVALRTIADIEKLRDVPPQSFDPAPKVHSSVIRMTPNRRLAEAERVVVIGLAKGAFQMRRKTLRHALTHALMGDDSAAVTALHEAGIDPGRRPGTLGVDEWRTLASVVSKRSARP